MIRTDFSIACLFVSALLALPSPAAAKFPSPANSSVPKVLVLVGRGPDGTADPIGEFRVILRDAAYTPVEGTIVTIDFGNCSDERVCSDQSPDATVDCADHWVVDATQSGPDGVARLRIVGSADHGVPATSGALARVKGDGVIVAFLRIAALDQDGGGLGPTDLALWLDDYFHSPGAARSDYDGDGVLGPGDLSIWLGAFFAGESVHGGAAASCPP